VVRGITHILAGISLWIELIGVCAIVLLSEEHHSFADRRLVIEQLSLDVGCSGDHVFKVDIGYRLSFNSCQEYLAWVIHTVVVICICSCIWHWVAVVREVLSCYASAVVNHWLQYWIIHGYWIFWQWATCSTSVLRYAIIRWTARRSRSFFASTHRRFDKESFVLRRGDLGEQLFWRTDVQDSLC